MCKVPADFPWGETLGFLSLIIGLNLCCFPQMKTVSVALVLCLNVGVDPPDVVKTSPCARLECWIGGCLRNLELKGKNVSFCLSSYASSPFLSCPLWSSSRFFFHLLFLLISTFSSFFFPMSPWFLILLLLLSLSLLLLPLFFLFLPSSSSRSTFFFYFFIHLVLPPFFYYSNLSLYFLHYPLVLPSFFLQRHRSFFFSFSFFFCLPFVLILFFFLPPFLINLPPLQPSTWAFIDFSNFRGSLW